mgnify:CR=1 FL=1
MKSEGGGEGGVMVCPRCGKVLRDDYAFCTHCGWDTRSGAVQGGFPPPPGYPYPSYWVPPRRVEPMAMASFICGLVSFFLVPFLPAVAALVLGILGRSRIKENPQLYEGDAYAVVGIILGAVNIFLTVVLVLVVVVSVLSQPGV